MTDVYRRLAKRLHELPNGYPETESGVELDILKKIFTPEEAEMTLKIRPMPETAEAIANRLEIPLDEMQPKLDNMTEKGQICSFKMFGYQVYMLFPYVIGIYEFQLDHMDKEMAEMHSKYLPDLVKTLGGFEPAVMRVIPVESEMTPEMEIKRYEDVRTMIDKAKSFKVSDCICRTEMRLEDKGCDKPLEVCLSFSREEEAFDKYPSGRLISKEEAVDIIKIAEEAGLVHCTYNISAGHVFVCNCCSCCCGILRGVKEYNAPYMLARSDFVATIDSDECESCGICADERCPMDAIIEEDDTYTVQPERCIGCGVCAPTCPTEAITLVHRPEEECTRPPKNLIDWTMQRAKARNIKVSLD
jgi:H+/Na+-translocating ferredoxin:NAD+ oxidoreductase subunit B